METRNISGKKIIAGIDESGRGAVIGPLVISGVSIEAEDEKKLKRINVKDSKELSPKRREQLAEKIEKIAKDVIVIKVKPCKIDSSRMFGTNLNRIEAARFLDAISFLRPHIVYIDGFETDTEKLRKFMEKMTNGIECIVEHKADSKYLVVGAASIIAKVVRDREIEKLRAENGDFGSGYPSDPKTIAWLKGYLETSKEYPDFVRKSWVTAEILKKEKRQLNLGSWLKKVVGK